MHLPKKLSWSINKQMIIQNIIATGNNRPAAVEGKPKKMPPSKLD